MSQKSLVASTARSAEAENHTACTDLWHVFQLQDSFHDGRIHCLHAMA